MRREKHTAGAPAGVAPASREAVDLPAAAVLTAQVVLLPSPAGLPDSLTYRVPDALQGAVTVGVPVLVPLGGRRQVGYVLRVEPLDARGPAAIELSRLRPIEAALRSEPAFPERMASLLEWMARRYRCALGDVLLLAVPERHACELKSVLYLDGWDGTLPPRIGPVTRRLLAELHRLLSVAGGRMFRDEAEAALRAPNLAQVLRRARAEGWIREEQVLLPPRGRPRLLQGVRLPPEAEAAAAAVRLGERQRKVLEYLRGRGDAVACREVCERLGVSASVLQSLTRRGLLESVPVAVRRAPRVMGVPAGAPETLTAAQEEAVRAIEGAIRSGRGEVHLLFGVTGSGKTEVYLRAIERARELGRGAILLVPEISLTAQVAAAVRQRLGERVAILHSALGEGERFDEWERVRRGEANVVVGPRSALFAPLPNLGLLILDEEHDSSYKQSERTPRYHARETALHLARTEGVCVVLGSATPSVETFHAALAGTYRLLELPERVQGRPLPAVEVVDLREETRTRPGAVFGRRLLEAIRQRLAAREQVVLFLNRRGYSAFLLCRDCGHVPRCPHCDVSLTLHRQRLGLLRCHHCDHKRPAPAGCERCGGARVRPFGIGTQRVQDAVRQAFPTARIARLDRDTVSARNAPARIVQQMLAGEIDILVGTQMVTKGFDFPRVTLVGVVTADVALNVPDFRAAERTFQLLAQVAGRAGRGDRPGEVIVQTFEPEHPAIRFAARHDYRGFFEEEIRAREEPGYPPFGALARLLASSAQEATARARAEAAAEHLRPLVGAFGVRLLGPAPCPLPRLRDRYRWHLLLKAPAREALDALLDEAWPRVQKRVGGVVVDVGPVDLL